MSESPPQLGDNETHNEGPEPKPNTEVAPDRGTGVTRPDLRTRARGLSGNGERRSNATEQVGGEYSDDDDDDDGDGEEEDEDEEDDEPNLKYARLTPHLGPVYKNGDATNAFRVAGDKMVWMPRPLAIIHAAIPTC